MSRDTPGINTQPCIYAYLFLTPAETPTQTLPSCPHAGRGPQGQTETSVRTGVDRPGDELVPGGGEDLEAVWGFAEGQTCKWSDTACHTCPSHLPHHTWSQVLGPEAALTPRPSPTSGPRSRTEAQPCSLSSAIHWPWCTGGGSETGVRSPQRDWRCMGFPRRLGGDAQ